MYAIYDSVFSVILDARWRVYIIIGIVYYCNEE